ncbi:MAG: lytic murein transglycosylase [Candidatus Pacebacteria bacterium]|jgi:peptidoglycan hydrolase CwlO-like protein|nr:lytic murein transglycosylase [Candidatus Paceibacterota bacterium]
MMRLGALKTAGLCVLALSVFLFPKLSLAATPSEERVALEAELAQLEEDIANLDKDITKTEQQKATLQNKITLLQSQIKRLNLQISQSNVVIKDLGYQIQDTQVSIQETSLQIQSSKDKLSAILRAVYEEDQRSIVEVLVSEGLDDFFDNLVALESLNDKNKELLSNIKALKISLEEQRLALDDEKDSLEKQVAIQTLQRQQSLSTKTEQDSLLKLTEAEYQKQLTEKKDVEQQAKAIRSRLFELIGVPEAPTFGEAYEIAKYVETLTGVRAPLLLAVLTQESNIGKNVGQCYLKDLTTGSGTTVKGTAISKVMKPSRDVQPFLQITEALGRDPLNTPVSCPIASVGGYGGAMGPAQYIPSTWLLFKDRIEDLKGGTADPWNIRDAFLAAGVYLAKVGATKQTYDYEWCAALSYFAGSCSSSNQIRYEFYGDSVMALAKRYEADIKQLQ